MSTVFKLLSGSIICILSFSSLASSEKNSANDTSTIKDIIHTYEKSIIVSVEKQKLYLIYKNELVKEFSISTSKFGVGFEKGSQKTPLGLHYIEKKIGDGVPINGIFNFRKFSGEVSIPDHPKFIEKDLITTRIMWLGGTNQENELSFKRFIYIHGTPEESKIGKPSSHGCIRMRNTDVYALFEFVEKGTPVYIKN